MCSRHESVAAKTLVNNWIKREVIKRKIDCDTLISKVGIQNASKHNLVVALNSKRVSHRKMNESIVRKEINDNNRAKDIKNKNEKQKQTARRIHDQQNTTRLQDLEKVNKVIHKYDGDQLKHVDVLLREADCIQNQNRIAKDKKEFKKRVSQQQLMNESEKLLKQEKLENWEIEYSPLREQFPKVTKEQQQLSPPSLQQKSQRPISKPLIDRMTYNRLLGSQKMPSSCSNNAIADIQLQITMGKSTQRMCSRTSVPFK